MDRAKVSNFTLGDCYYYRCCYCVYEVDGLLCLISTKVDSDNDSKEPTHYC